jgi:hypothetical protein
MRVAGKLQYCSPEPFFLSQGAHSRRVLLLIAKALHKVVVVFTHGWDEACERVLSTRLSPLFRWVYGRADAFIVLGKGSRTDCGGWVTTGMSSCKALRLRTSFSTTVSGGRPRIAPVKSRGVQYPVPGRRLKRKGHLRGAGGVPAPETEISVRVTERRR